MKSTIGIVGIENAFQLLYTKPVKNKVFDLQQLIDWMTVKLKLFKLKTGVIEKGRRADLTVIDIDREYTLDKNEFLSNLKIHLSRRNFKQ